MTRGAPVFQLVTRPAASNVKMAYSFRQSTIDATESTLRVWPLAAAYLPPTSIMLLPPCAMRRLRSFCSAAQVRYCQDAELTPAERQGSRSFALDYFQLYYYDAATAV